MSATQQRRLSWALRLLALLAFTFATLSSTATAPAGAATYGHDNLASDSSTLMESIGNPNTRFTVSLDGFSGTGTYSQVMGAAQRGATPLARATEWEIMQLQQAGRLGDVTFVRGGQAVPNPWAG